MSQTQPTNLGQRQYFNLKTLIYSGPGGGKSVYTGSSNGMLKTFMFDVDDGAMSVKRFSPRPDLIDTWQVESHDDFGMGFKYLVDNMKDYNHVSVDSATELQRLILQENLKQRKIAYPDQRSWGAVLIAMDNIARWFHHMPLHVTWVAHEVERDDEETGRRMYQPSFQGAFARDYGRHFSGIFRLAVLDQQVINQQTQKPEFVTHRLLQCQRDAVVHAKDRSGVLEKFEPVNIDHIINKMMWGIQNAQGAQTQNV